MPWAVKELHLRHLIINRPAVIFYANEPQGFCIKTEGRCPKKLNLAPYYQDIQLVRDGLITYSLAAPCVSHNANNSKCLVSSQIKCEICYHLKFSRIEVFWRVARIRVPTACCWALADKWAGWFLLQILLDNPSRNAIAVLVTKPRIAKWINKIHYF